MITGSIKIGVQRKAKKQYYLDKHYPIKGRKDFYKWVVVTPQGLAKDYKDEVMYFDSFNLDRAKDVLKAIKKTAKLNREFLN